MTACGSTPGTVRPDDMTADQHRREAEREQRKADDQVGPYAYPTSVYDPSDYQLREAHRHRAHAAEHLRAAAELERFEDAACQGLPPSTRASCPLLGPATAIVDIDGGVRVELAEGVPVEAVVALMRCHYAYARAHGFGSADDCPLYVSGIDIRASADGRAVEITATDAATVELVRKRAREEAVPGSPTT